MLKLSNAFSSFSVNDLQQAKSFYADTLGLSVTEEDHGLRINTGETSVFAYPKPNHTPATFTILNFPVQNIEQAVSELSGRGVSFEQYDGEMKTDPQGIARDHGMSMAWFKDPAGNFISVVEAKQ